MMKLSRLQLLQLSCLAALSCRSIEQKQHSHKQLKISLAEYSYHRRLYAGNPKANRYKINTNGEKPLDHLDFPKAARELGIEAVEYVNIFFPDMNFTDTYLKEMKQRADDQGVKSLLIMVGREGDLGAANQAELKKAVQNHKKWLDAAAALDCHSIRVDAKGSGPANEQIKRIGESLNKLASYGDQYKLNVIVENHGGLSSDGNWLAQVIEAADHSAVGSLPDYGNFYDNATKKFYDPYKGTRAILPYAKAVSAKTYDLVEGSESTMRHPKKGYEIDFERLVKMTIESGYRGYIGIEYEGGNNISEKEGILMSKKLLEKYFQKYIS